MNTTLKMWGPVFIIVIICRDSSKMLDSENASSNLSKLELSSLHTRTWNFSFRIHQGFGIFPMNYSNWRQAVVGPLAELIECPQFYTGFRNWTCLQHTVLHASLKMPCLMFYLQHPHYMSAQPLFEQFNPLETDPFRVSSRRRQMTVMTSGITGPSSLFNILLWLTTTKHQRSA